MTPFLFSNLPFSNQLSWNNRYIYKNPWRPALSSPPGICGNRHGNACVPWAFWSISSHRISPLFPNYSHARGGFSPRFPARHSPLHLLTPIILKLHISPTELVLSLFLLFSLPLSHMWLSSRVSHHLSLFQPLLFRVFQPLYGSSHPARSYVGLNPFLTLLGFFVPLKLFTHDLHRKMTSAVQMMPYKGLVFRICL